VGELPTVYINDLLGVKPMNASLQASIDKILSSFSTGGGETKSMVGVWTWPEPNKLHIEGIGEVTIDDALLRAQFARLMRNTHKGTKGGLDEETLKKTLKAMSFGLLAPWQLDKDGKPKEGLAELPPTTNDIRVLSAEEYKASIISSNVKRDNAEHFGTLMQEFESLPVLDTSDNKVPRKDIMENYNKMFSLLAGLSAVLFPAEKQEVYTAMVEQEEKDKETFAALITAGFEKISRVPDSKDGLMQAYIPSDKITDAVKALPELGYEFVFSNFNASEMKLSITFKPAKKEEEPAQIEG
jgi:hypothetical protein